MLGEADTLIVSAANGWPLCCLTAGKWKNISFWVTYPYDWLYLIKYKLLVPISTMIEAMIIIMQVAPCMLMKTEETARGSLSQSDDIMLNSLSIAMVASGNASE